MKNLVSMKIVLVVLALSFAVPRPAMAIGEFAPFTDLVEDLADAIDQVIEETDGVVASFGADSKVSKHLVKGQASLEKARQYVSLAAQKSGSTEFPNYLKKIGSGVKKWSARMDKAAKASATKSGKETIVDSQLQGHLTAWTAILVVALVAIITTALSLSFSFYSQFTKGTEKKHIKGADKFDAAMLAFQMSGFVFVPASFNFALKSTKKGMSLLVGSLLLSIFLIAFIANAQSQS